MGSLFGQSCAPRRDCGHNGIEIGVRRLPRQGGLDAAAIGEQRIGIARAAALHVAHDLVVDHAINCIEHFEHGEAAPIAKVHDEQASGCSASARTCAAKSCAA